MIENTELVVIFKFLFIENWYLCKYKPLLAKIYFVDSAWTSFKKPPFDFKFKSIETFKFLCFVGF